MSHFRAIPFSADLIEKIADIIADGPAVNEKATVIFPGKRPSLYLKAHLARVAGGRPFFPPRCFSLDEFVDHIARRRYPAFEDLDNINAVWLLFSLIKTLPVFQGHSFRTRDFSEFLNRGLHLLSFMERLDTEGIGNDVLTRVERNAAIGYDIPPSVNELLANISILRARFHTALAENSWFTRGTKHLAAAEEADKAADSDPAPVIFAGIFGPTGTEKSIIRSFWDANRAEIVVCGNPEEWPALKEFASYLKAHIEYSEESEGKAPVICLHSGHDTHSEVLEAYRVIHENAPAKTAIVLPDPGSLFPLLDFAVDRTDTPCNISLRHPMDRTSLYNLVRGILDAAAERRTDGAYPTDRYLGVILHPFIKNMYPVHDLRKVLSHVERIVSGDNGEGTFSGMSGVFPDEIETKIAPSSDGSIDPESFEALKTVHALLFRNFENTATIRDIADNLEHTLDEILNFTSVRSYTLSGPIFDSLFSALQTLKRTLFADAAFSENPAKNIRALRDIALTYLSAADLPFDTHPVEELEILGMLEARNIAFDRLIILDVNEGVLPGPRQINPVVPIGVFETLGIPSPDVSESVYRYNFYRLVEGAREVHLIFKGSDDRLRSRYIEEIIWKEERRQKKIGVMPAGQTILTVNLKRETLPPVIEKTDSVILEMRRRGFSSSSLDAYVACPLLFYFTRLMGFEEKQAFSTDIDGSSRGNVIHRILFDTFHPFLGMPLTKDSQSDIMESFNRAFGRRLEDTYNSGEYYLFRRMAHYKIQSFIRRHFDNMKDTCVIRYLEEKLTSRFLAGDAPVILSGTIDRIDSDQTGQTYTIIDYKTGYETRQYPAKILSKTDFTDMLSIHDHVPSLQLPVYINIFCAARGVPTGMIDARLFKLGTNVEESFNPGKAGDPSPGAAYTEGIRTVISHMLDPDKPFAAFDTKKCMDCRARNLCHV